jgi:hypothetical protein
MSDPASTALLAALATLVLGALVLLAWVMAGGRRELRAGRSASSI